MAILKSILVVLLVGTFCNSLAQTRKEDRIDEEYQKCIAKDTSYVNLSNCAFVAFAQWDKEMEKTYKKLLKATKKGKDMNALIQAQKAWVAYKNAEFNSYNNMYNLPGNKWSMLRLDSRIELVRARTLQLRGYLESLHNH